MYVKAITKVNKMTYTGRVLNHLLDQKLNKVFRFGLSFSSILSKIPPIKNPLKTKKIATPSSVTIRMIDLYFSGTKIAL